MKLKNQITVPKTQELDVVVVGGTPGGITSAIAAARLGCTVALIEFHNHIGGMTTSGLGKSDIENKKVIGGLFKEFTTKVHNYYTNRYGKNSLCEKQCKEGYYYEPHVAELIFTEMIKEEVGITVFTRLRIEKVLTEQNKISVVIFKNRFSGQVIKLNAKVFIDATYEGDLYASAGAAYKLGRESNTEFGEEHAGKIFFDYNKNIFLPGSTGEGDDSLPAYTYRLCLTDNPENSYYLSAPPTGYDRNNYIGYFKDMKDGRLAGPKVFKEGHGYYSSHFNTMMRVFSFARIPNNKFDVNINPRPLGFPFPEENDQYVEVGWTEREKIFKRLRSLTLGLLYFVQNDYEIPEEQRLMAKKYNLCKDEFIDNQHFPYQLYVREARRLKGKITLTENDLSIKNGLSRTRIFYDSVMAGEFPIDSFPVSKISSQDKKVLEGYIGMLETQPYQVPYRALIPEKIEGLIVPIAASTTHVAYSTLRMEPLWMGLGQAAGTASSLAIKKQTVLSDIPINILQIQLIEQGQVLTYFEDMNIQDKAYKAAQFWGTKGFFHSYQSNLRLPLSIKDFNHWIEIFYDIFHIKKYIPRFNAKEKSISLSRFSFFIERIIKDCLIDVLPKLDRTFLDQKADEKPLWSYYERDDSLPLLRGEACLTFYLLLKKGLRYEKSD